MEGFILPLAGGALIGLSSSIMLLSLGKITGISGIFASSLFSRDGKSGMWRYFFIIGLLAGGLLIKSIFPEFFQYEFDSPIITIVISGVLVGFGTRLGSGCTSGHGVCGMPRKSMRSIVATFTFIGFGMLTVYVKGLL